MPKDALTIYRAACELDILVGGRIDKVNMPNADTLVFNFHTQKGNFKLLLSCNPSLPRVHITAMQYKNPDTASGTLMYFRKRLTGAVLTGIEKFECERMIRFDLSALDELRERVKYSLYAELTGKCANIVFTDGEGVIGAALRRISADAPGKRAVFPGLAYAYPNPTGRVGVFDAEALKARLTAFEGVTPRTAMQKCVAGLADGTVNEVFYRIGGDVDNAVDRFIAEAQTLYSRPLSPTVTFDGEKPLDYFIVPYATAGGEGRSYPTLNAAMDDYYSKLFAAADLAAYVKPLRAAVKSAIAKNTKRQAEAAAKIAESESAEDDRKLGDLITANIYRIKRGDRSATVVDYYDENGGSVTIPLDPTLNAQQNAALRYKAYNKKKRAAVYAAEALRKAQSALYELNGIAAELELCSEKCELDEVRAELVELGLMKPEKKRRKEKPIESSPYSFDIMGATLLVGKNNAQNDRITRAAARTEIWLHVKDAHGCHAVLKTPSPTDEQLLRAAEITAYYSKARGADKADVDHTQIKNVFRKGGGHVDYKDYKTLTVKPRI